MDEAQQYAYGQMAQALAWHADGWAKSWDFRFPGVSEPIYHHLSDSTFEGVADCLWKLKIFRALDEKCGWASHFILNCALNDAHQVGIVNREFGPPFDELLYTAINLFGDYGASYWGFSTQRGPAFGKDGRLAALLDALVPLGYLEKTEAGYVWTDRIVPIMYAAGYETDSAEVDTLRLSQEET